MNEQHVGLLGATSLVGQYLLNQLLQNRYHVTAFSRRLFKENNPQIIWQQVDKRGYFSSPKENKTIPLWLCTIPIWILPEHFDLLSAYGARRIVVLSSTSRFTKNSSTDPKEREIAMQLIKSEERVQVWMTAHKIEWIILRPTMIYGLGRDKNIAEMMRFIRRFGFFPVFGPALGLRQPIHAEDVAVACYKVLHALNLVNRSYNLVGGETLTYRAMVYRVFAALHQSPRILTIPRWFFQIVIWGIRWLPRYRYWTTAMAERMNQDLNFDGSDLQQDLNFFPRAFELSAIDLPGQK
ncbi:NAD-dependent epimerase/dehydratase family protein [Nitrosomonas supralitoralis]|uniref:Epimerase n=1 Tax=Nitrosomonas supralitoralis TaxID=2116706 RepID=A0A2P7NVA4_9PROT|nr:NAD-dependent epimerase/dehydratase family protein [Nitrosomonas supralitoralis]PSJ17400.1 epimerase [Nitrosomonas supralitoralis]